MESIRLPGYLKILERNGFSIFKKNEPHWKGCDKYAVISARESYVCWFKNLRNAEKFIERKK